MKKIFRKEALKISKKMLIDAEIGRKKVSELEAKELVVPTNQNPLPSMKIGYFAKIINNNWFANDPLIPN